MVPTDTPTVPITDTPVPTDTPTPAGNFLPRPVKGIPAASLVGQIAYPVFNGSSYDLYVGQVDGSGTRLLQGQASQPAFSPDGSRLAFHSWNTRQRGLMAMNAAGGGGLLLTAFAEDQLPTWNPDNTITLLSRRSGSRKSELYRVSSITERSDATLLGEGEYPTSGSIGILVFKGWGNSGIGLQTASPDFKNVRPLTDHDDDTAPALSPDGDRVAFMSRRNGNWDIYVVDIDGENLQQITTDPAQDGLPAWSPDGKVLAFVSDRDEQWALWAITPTGDTVQQLFTIAGSPDGFVGADSFASRGWAEERISWSQ
jgi:dipeptidyl aminopeptidase/acylaminoacyl peptidase